MAQESFLDTLRCPYCGGGLALDSRHPADGADVEFGTLSCRCYRYPVVLGIVVLRQTSAPSDNSDPVVAALDRGDRDGAVAMLLAGSGGDDGRKGGRRAAVTRLVQGLRGRPPAPARGGFAWPETLRAALRHWRPDSYGEYLEYRYGNPSLLAAVPVIAAAATMLGRSDLAASPPTVLDLGCGIGQTSYLLKSLAPRVRLVAGDLDFLNLALAKHYVVPEGNFVCFDAEAGLPFRDATFDATFSLDCVHYIRGKDRLAAELRRTGRPGALYAICHLHNAGQSNPNQGIPLSADGYAQVFGRLGGKVYGEPALLESFCESGSLALSRSAAADRAADNAFTYLALGEAEAETAALRLDRYIAARLPSFALNALYDSVDVDGTVELRLRWPSEKLRSECATGFEPLREKVVLTRDLTDAVLGHRLHEVPEETCEALIRSFVLVPEPAGLRTPG